MGKKAMVIGFTGEKLTEKIKRKIETLITSAIVEYEVTDFYFGNELEDFDETETEEKPILLELAANSHEITEFIISVIKNYKSNEIISTVMIAARLADKNYNANLFDEIIQAYHIFHNEVDSENTIEIYDLRDSFLIENIDFAFWYSNKILGNTSSLFKLAEGNNKQIIFN